MLKILGGIMLTAATTAIGLSVARDLRKRVQILSQLCSAIEIMRGEILSRMTPIPELFEALSKEMDAPVSTFFLNAMIQMKNLGNHPFLTIWRNAIDMTPELMLTKDELSALRDLGYVLGRYGSTEQAGILDFAKRRFDGFLEAARVEREKKGRISIAFGVAAGLLCVIMFL